MNADGTDQVNISNDPSMDLVRSWSWDGNRILFDSDRGGSRDIFIMEIDGSKVNQLTDWNSAERIAMMAPGNRIAFSSTKNGNEDIFSMNEDGSNIELLIQTDGNEFYPVFSRANPDLMIFISDKDGEREVYLIDLLDGKISRITFQEK